MLEQPIDTVQGRVISELSNSYALLTSGPESNPAVVNIDDDYGQAVTEAVSTEDTSFTYIGKHNSFLRQESGHATIRRKLIICP